MQRLQALHGILIDDDVGGGDNEFSLVRTEQRPVTGSVLPPELHSGLVVDMKIYLGSCMERIPRYLIPGSAVGCGTERRMSYRIHNCITVYTFIVLVPFADSAYIHGYIHGYIDPSVETGRRGQGTEGLACL